MKIGLKTGVKGPIHFNRSYPFGKYSFVFSEKTPSYNVMDSRVSADILRTFPAYLEERQDETPVEIKETPKEVKDVPKKEHTPKDVEKKLESPKSKEDEPNPVQEPVIEEKHFNIEDTGNKEEEEKKPAPKQTRSRKPKAN